MSSGKGVGEELGEDVLKDMLEQSQRENPEKLSFTPEEADKFKKAFEDPEFRKLFAGYMDELQDPKNRDETEAYISQLEGEQKVPEGKELIRPDPGFVAKTHKIPSKDEKNATKEKVFLNIVQSAKISGPSKTSTAKGDCWSVPYSLGPPHMEKDKNGNNAPCFDCCFHPEALRLGMMSKEFKDLLVTTAMDGVEQGYKQQGHNVSLQREFHVVKGINYKSGTVPTMMISTASKEKWEAKQDVSSTAAAVVAETEQVSQADCAGNKEKSVQEKSVQQKKKPAIKKGFLNSAKSSIYDDKLTTIRPSNKLRADGTIRTQPVEQNNETSADISMPTAGSVSTSKHSGTATSSLIEDVTGKKQMPTTKANIAAGAADTATQKSEDSAASFGLKAVATTKRKLETVPQQQIQEVEVPSYTVKERGHLGMGDFERSDAVVSSRPSELVYNIHLPKIGKASLLELDVAERILSLKYCELYALRINLPYPVHDKRTTAKYDKASKSLCVTLPVKAAPIEKIQRAVPSTDVPSAAVQQLPMPPTEEPMKSDQSSPAKSDDGRRKHDRWVSGKDNDGASDSATATAPSSSSALYEEIQRKAAEAVEKAKKQQQNPSATKVEALAVAAVGTKTTETTFECTEDFVPSRTFTGHKKGYAFRTGEKGIGYYLDHGGAILSSTAPSPSPVPSAAADVVVTKCAEIPFECRQMKQTIAILVQVPAIDSTTCEVHFGKYSIDMKFSAGCEQYAMGLQLDSSQCHGGLAMSQCRYDVAAHNMALVLTKNLPGYWPSNDCKAEEQSVEESKSESADAAIDKFTRKLFSVRSFAPPASNDGENNDADVSLMKSLHQSLQALQFSSNDALFELD